MAHFAKVVDGIVTQVIVAEPEFFDTFVDNSPGQWIKTSYNVRGGVYYDPETNEPAEDQSVIAEDEGRQRKNYAGIGFSYDGVGFAPPQPFPSWTFNTDTYLWECPLPMPEETQEETDAGLYYVWSEEAYQADTADPKTQGWILNTAEVG